MLVKKALIRDPSVPQGQPGPMHINCTCGRKLPIANPFSADLYPCECGVTYDGSGYIK